MTRRTPQRKPRYADPRVVALMADKLHATGHLTGNIEAALTEVIENRVLDPKIQYKAVEQKDPHKPYRPQPGDLFAWSFRNDDTGTGKVHEVIRVVSTNIGAKRVYPHYGNAEVEALNLSTGRIETVYVTRWERKVELI